MRVLAAIVLLLALAVRAEAQPLQACGQGAIVNVNIAAATDTQVVTPVSGRAVFVCAVEASANGTNSFYLESSSAGTCGGNLTPMGTTRYTITGTYVPPTYAPGLNIPQGYGLCVHTTASPALSVTVWYAQHP